MLHLSLKGHTSSCNCQSDWGEVWVLWRGVPSRGPGSADECRMHGLSHSLRWLDCVTPVNVFPLVRWNCTLNSWENIYPKITSLPCCSVQLFQSWSLRLKHQQLGMEVHASNSSPLVAEEEFEGCKVNSRSVYTISIIANCNITKNM
jgi:hypothetical protein